MRRELCTALLVLALAVVGVAAGPPLPPPSPPPRAPPPPSSPPPPVSIPESLPRQNLAELLNAAAAAGKAATDTAEVDLYHEHVGAMLLQADLPTDTVVGLRPRLVGSGDEAVEIDSWAILWPDAIAKAIEKVKEYVEARGDYDMPPVYALPSELARHALEQLDKDQGSARTRFRWLKPGQEANLTRADVEPQHNVRIPRVLGMPVAIPKVGTNLSLVVLSGVDPPRRRRALRDARGAELPRAKTVFGLRRYSVEEAEGGVVSVQNGNALGSAVSGAAVAAVLASVVVSNVASVAAASGGSAVAPPHGGGGALKTSALLISQLQYMHVLSFAPVDVPLAYRSFLATLQWANGFLGVGADDPLASAGERTCPALAAERGVGAPAAGDPSDQHVQATLDSSALASPEGMWLVHVRLLLLALALTLAASLGLQLLYTPTRAEAEAEGERGGWVARVRAAAVPASIAPPKPQAVVGFLFFQGSVLASLVLITRGPCHDGYLAGAIVLLALGPLCFGLWVAATLHFTVLRAQVVRWRPFDLRALREMARAAKQPAPGSSAAARILPRKLKTGASAEPAALAGGAESAEAPAASAAVGSAGRRRASSFSAGRAGAGLASTAKRLMRASEMFAHRGEWVPTELAGQHGALDLAGQHGFALKDRLGMLFEQRTRPCVFHLSFELGRQAARVVAVVALPGLLVRLGGMPAPRAVLATGGALVGLELLDLLLVAALRPFAERSENLTRGLLPLLRSAHIVALFAGSWLGWVDARIGTLALVNPRLHALVVAAPQLAALLALFLKCALETAADVRSLRRRVAERVHAAQVVALLEAHGLGGEGGLDAEGGHAGSPAWPPLPDPLPDGLVRSDVLLLAHAALALLAVTHPFGQAVVVGAAKEEYVRAFRERAAHPGARTWLRRAAPCAPPRGAYGATASARAEAHGAALERMQAALLERCRVEFLIEVDLGRAGERDGTAAAAGRLLVGALHGALQADAVDAVVAAAQLRGVHEAAALALGEALVPAIGHTLDGSLRRAASAALAAVLPPDEVVPTPAELAPADGGGDAAASRPGREREGEAPGCAVAVRAAVARSRELACRRHRHRAAVVGTADASHSHASAAASPLPPVKFVSKPPPPPDSPPPGVWQRGQSGGAGIVGGGG